MTPELQLRTMFVLDERGRSIATREPQPARNRGPFFILIRGTSSCAWAVRSDLSADAAGELNRLARDEPPMRDFHDEPVHAQRYLSLCGGRIVAGPAFSFPEKIAQPDGVETVTELGSLQRHFRGWVASEIPERSPILAVMYEGYPVSVCFSARGGQSAAEAGVETASSFRGHGLASLATAAWALAIRASGRIPLYSTSWSNAASLAVARKLGLVVYASDWSLVEDPSSP